MRAALTRVLSWRYYVPLTALGALASGGALALRGYYAPQHADVVLHAAAALVLGIIAISAVAVAAAALALRRSLRRHCLPAELLELETDSAVSTGFTLGRLRLMPLLEVELAWAEPRAVAVTLAPHGRRRVEVVQPSERGLCAHLTRRIIVRDVFGLARIGIRLRQERAVRVRPARLAATAEVLQHIVGGDTLSHPAGPAEGELLDMRRYADGDPLRHVLWRAFARSRQLLVRTPERAIAPSPSGIAYFIAGSHDEATAAVARHFVENGLLGADFLFAADGAAQPTRTAPVALEQIIASIHERAHGAEGLARFLATVDAHRRATCVLFAPPNAGAWLQHVERAAPLIRGATVLIGTADDLGASPRRRFARWLSYAPPSRTRATTLPQTVQALTRAGYAVRVLHHPSGRVISAPVLAALAPRLPGSR